MILSISDAVSSVRFIIGLVSQVKDNREDLLRVANRIQHITLCLEDAKRRDILQQQEYTDALVTVSFMIEKAQRIVQRQLKRSLGDRTWRRDEIKNEIQRLGEDVQTYLSVHTIKTLDTFQASHNLQLTTISNNVEDILVKLAAMDTRFRAPRGDPWSSRILYHARLINEDVQQQSVTDTTPVTDDERGGIAQALSAAGRTTLHVKGVFKRWTLQEPESIILQDLRSNATYEEIINKIKSAGYAPPKDFKEDTMVVTVTDLVSEYDPGAPGGLQIASSIPIIHWWNKYSAYHGIGLDESAPRPPLIAERLEMLGGIPYHGMSSTTTPSHTVAELNAAGNSVTVGGVTFSFHRTLRVPETSTINNLPSGFGRFPLLPVSKFVNRLPESICSRGGFIMPMFQREALWISFNTTQSHKPAVKISVGNINVISGIHKDVATPPSKGQDYIVAGTQVWLDGAMTDSGVVRQFVAMPLGKGYTVEEQVTGESKGGGFQFDVFPRRSHPGGKFIHYNKVGVPYDDQYDDAPRIRSDMTPAELHLNPGEKIGLYPRTNGVSIERNWTLSDYRRRINPSTGLKAIYPGRYYKPPPPIYTGGVIQLSVDRRWWGLPGGEGPKPEEEGNGASSSRKMLPSRNVDPMGLAVGGKIGQKIYKDSISHRMYDEENGRRFHVHILSPESWECVTGMVSPITPIGPETYKLHDVPWFSLYDGDMKSIETAAESLRKLRPVRSLDKGKGTTLSTPTALIDPDRPPNCSMHDEIVGEVVLRPCSHIACDACLGKTLLNRSLCLTCDAPVARFVGMKVPVPQTIKNVSGEDEDGMAEWNVTQLEDLALEAADSKNITIIHLEKDRVSPLYSHTD